MKILILEDNEQRINIFKKKLEGLHELFFFDNIEDAKKAVEAFGPFDMYFLDHDLDSKVYVDSNEPNTGYQFAKFLNAKQVSGDIIIHSMNPAGAKYMLMELPQARQIPFPFLF